MKSYLIPIVALALFTACEQRTETPAGEGTTIVTPPAATPEPQAPDAAAEPAPTPAAESETATPPPAESAPAPEAPAAPASETPAAPATAPQE